MTATPCYPPPRPATRQRHSYSESNLRLTASVERIGKKLGTAEPEQLEDIYDGFNQIIGT